MRYGSGMTKTIDTVTITATEQDRVTLEGIAEFERGEFIGIEEWITLPNQYRLRIGNFSLSAS